MISVGYLECFAGISGDMLLGALVDAGVPQPLLQRAAASLNLGAELAFDYVDRSGIRSLKARVLVEGREADAPAPAPRHTADDVHDHGHAHDHDAHAHAHDPLRPHEHVPEHSHPHSRPEAQPAHVHPHVHGRTLPAIRALIEQAPIADGARRIALNAFELLGRAEAKIHGVPLESVHFHEVGAVDAIVDIVCAAVGLDSLGVERWRCSAINVGSGFVHCAHGRFPVPAPAAAELLRGAPTYSSGAAMELVTPTGAALLRALDCDFSLETPFVAQAIGYGAGSRNPPRFPNVLRLSVGQERGAKASSSANETVSVLECAIDDLSPQVAARAAELLLDRGALDVMRASVVMKKGRLGEHFTVLCRPADAARFEELLFAETSTLGVRVRQEQRIALARRSVEIDTEFGPVRIKVGEREGHQVNAAPEYEDCRLRAVEHGVPLKRVIEAALASWRAAAHPRQPARPSASIA